MPLKCHIFTQFVQQESIPCCTELCIRYGRSNQGGNEGYDKNHQHEHHHPHDVQKSSTRTLSSSWCAKIINTNIIILMMYKNRHHRHHHPHEIFNTNTIIIMMCDLHQSRATQCPLGWRQFPARRVPTLNKYFLENQENIYIKKIENRYKK